MKRTQWSPAARFARQLHRLLYRGGAAELMKDSDWTWTEGLCWILAEGILRWISISRACPRKDVSLAVVGDALCPVHHVVVCVRSNRNTRHEYEWYLDANGVSTKTALLGYWRRAHALREPFIAPYDEDLLLHHHIPRDARMSTRVAQCLREEFGLFTLALLHATSPRAVRRDELEAR